MQKHHSCSKIDRKPFQTCLNAIFISNPSSNSKIKMQGFPSALGCSQSGAAVGLMAGAHSPVDGGSRMRRSVSPLPLVDHSAAQRPRGHSSAVAFTVVRSQWSLPRCSACRRHSHSRSLTNQRSAARLNGRRFNSTVHTAAMEQ